MSKLLVLALGAIAATFAISSASGGDPSRGGVVWTSNGCGACHAFRKAGTTGTAGPSIDRWLVPNARRLKLSTGAFAYRRIYWGGRGMPAYGTLTPQELDDLVSFVTGEPYTAPPGTPALLPPLPPPPPVVRATAATVRRWVQVERLSPRAAQGAAVFARTGCLGCHTYLGSGVRRRNGIDLSRIGARGRSGASFAAYVARPYRSGNDLMPAYADLGADALARVGSFLAGSRGRR